MMRAFCLQLVLVVHAAALRRSSTVRKNVLYIIADDFRTEMTPYGHNTVFTPNLQKLSDSSHVFMNAHAQSQLCSPSRSSFLVGRRPQTTKVLNTVLGVRSFRETGPDWTTLPGYFKKNGYWVTGVGKTFHEGNEKFDWPKSWSEDDEYFWTEIRKCPRELDVWCMIDSTEHADFEDTLILDEALRRLKIGADKAKRGTAPQPFFLNVGFNKPHIPYRVPKKYFDMYPLDQIKLAEHQRFPSDVTGLAYNKCDNIEDHYAMEGHEPYPADVQRKLRRGYYAAISFLDDNVGKLLAGLDATGLANDTIVIFHSDHGYHLGEWNLYCKNTNFNMATHVSMMIRAPFGAYAPSMGSKSSALVELVDVFPTAVELAGLPPMTPRSTEPPLEGRSLAPLLTGGSHDRSDGGGVAFSQFSRNRCLDDLFVEPSEYFEKHNVWCKSEVLTGFSVRTADWRLTEWVTVDEKSALPDWHRGIFETATELYAHPGGLDETDNYDASETGGNLAKDASHASIKATLRDMLRNHFRGE